MRQLYSLFVLLFFAVSLQAQTTIWLGGSTDWDDPANWTDGIPSSGDTATIPANPPNGSNFPIYDNGPLVDFTIQSFGGDLTFDAVVYNTGSIINSGGGNIISNQVFINAGMVTFNNNDGTFINNGTADNYGTFNNAGTSTLSNPAGSTFNNYGDIDNFGTITNGGTIVNNGNITSTSTITNNGIINNNGFFDIAFGGNYTNGTGAELNTSAGSFVDVNSNFLNDGSVTSNGSFFIQTASTFTNNGSFTANYSFDLSGDFINNGTLVTSDQMSINDSGLLDNNSLATNTGTITLSICGQVIQNDNNTITGTVLNDGIIYEIGGLVDVTSNLEFGSEFTNLNQRKAPDVKCRSGMLVFLDENGIGTISVDAVDKNSFGFCGASIASRVLSQDSFTVADLGVNELTLTITDNFGESGTCNSFITVVDYFPPVIPVDDPDITFSCPPDITVTPLAGAPNQVASWTEPTATTTCTNNGGGPVSCDAVSNTINGFSYLGEFNNSKYFISNTNFSWDAARTEAEANNGFLVTINDATENDFVRNNITTNTWIGFNDQTTEGTFEWVSGEAATYTNWNTNEPNDFGTGEDVTEMLTSGLWNDNAASSSRPFVLEIACSNSPLACSSVPENFSGFTYLGEFNDSKYFVSQQASNWANANSTSQSNGGNLLVIESQAENDFVQNNINPSSGSIWTGLNNINNGSVFQWVTGSPLVYTNWQNGEPNGAPNTHGVRLRNDTGEWTDRPATDLYEYVFEIPCDNSAPFCEDVVVQITFDNYPEDISWVINDSNGSAVASGGNYGSSPDGSTVTLTNCLVDGCYDFVLTDSYGDGLCCSYGNGSWSISNADGTVYGSGAQFTTTQTASFCITTGNSGGGGGNGGGNGLTVQQIAGGQNGGSFPVGINEVSYSVTDNCGNQEICTFTVTVEDTPAAITINDCPADIIVNTAPGAPTANVSWAAPTASTDCFKPNTTIEQTIGLDSGSDFLIGTENIAYAITDSCGNFQACSFNVTVQEVAAVLSLTSCPGDQSVQVPIGQTLATVTWIEPTGTSDCYTGAVVANQLVGPSSGSDFPIGVTQVVYVLTDQCGNSELCAFNINVSEVCPAAGTSCDDGDPSTENDEEDGNCNCVGTPCPTAGTACDDGDATTENDVEDGNCGCAGTPCPTAGTTCDDGDATTENDVEDGNCNCAGTPIVCPPAGTVCDDGDASTENDVEDGNCNCAGTPCPTVGTTCDDGDATTENDVEDGNCGCAGTPIIAGCSTTENLALSVIASASQSSVNLGAEASRAIDGNTSGDFFGQNSVSLTNWETNAWWEVDLGLIANIETMNIWNREDCCTQFLANYYIFVSDVPFTSTDINTTLNQTGVSSFLQTDPAGLPSAININTTGRYVRIQLLGTSFLGLAEVEVIGCIAGSGCAPAGTACDDGDATTENDVEDGNCGCAGTPCPVVGTTCDDGNPNTENDMADGSCGCAGTPIGGSCTTTSNLATAPISTATQSSVQLEAEASRAIDGNTSGDFYGQNSVALTTWETQPWVEVDLGVIGIIESINVWNRTDCCAGFLKNYYILVSDVPFVSQDLQATLAQSGVDGYLETATAGTPSSININRTGRYVRLQLQGTSFLGLAELEIIGCTDAGGCPAAGTACDDGDASTENDVEDGNCGCAGTPCPTAGTTCDDGDANTENDMEDGNCNCTGTPINCPVAGTACDDGDASTENDVEDGNCGCAGTPCPIAGTICDDGDANTENDVEDGNCGCAGTPLGGCPATTNVALTGTASQSSTLTAGAITGNAEKAIDGNSNGVFFTGDPTASSVTATNNTLEPYWEVMLDANYLIEQIDVYNRTDGSDRSQNIYVLVSSTPFTATDLAGARAEADWEEFIPGLVGSPSTVLPNLNGQYVRIQMEGSGYLVLAEVEIFGCTTAQGFAIPNMLYFNALKDGIQTNIDWMMAKDVDVDFYEVEVSTDGSTFRLLEDVNSQQVNSPRQYDVVDSKPEFGENFYRLKVNQLDGSYFYSNVRRVNFEIDFEEVIIYPNPTDNFINIALRDFAGKSGTVEIFNQLGQKMTSRNYQSFPTIPAVFDVSDLVNGIYTISIKVENHKRFTKKFVITKL